VRIALFLTCLVDAVAPAAGRATVELLERLGHQVVFPPGQTCCGQMHVNTGYPDEALPLVRRYVETFEPYEVVVAPGAGDRAGRFARLRNHPARAGRPSSSGASQSTYRDEEPSCQSPAIDGLSTMGV